MTISDWHIMGYNGYWDGHWTAPAQAIEELQLDADSKPAQAVRRGMELAIQEATHTQPLANRQNASQGEI